MAIDTSIPIEMYLASSYRPDCDSVDAKYARSAGWQETARFEAEATAAHLDLPATFAALPA